MDTSREYIDMRYKARCDMKDGVPPEYFENIEGDYIDPVWVADDVFVDKKGDFYYSTDIESCQLERQDQLQEMLGECVKSFRLFVDKIGYKNPDYDVLWAIVGYYEEFTSMEQLWLAFVMKEKFNKTWNGSDWV